MGALAHGTRLLGFDFLLELSQTLCIAEFFVTVLRTEHERFAAAGVTVLTDGQVVYVAEAEKTGVAADLVDDIMSYDLMFANAISAAHAAL